MADQLTFTNPVTRFPDITPPKQDQPEPGLDAELIPGTDRGEESYRGTGRLQGRRALITGADSGIGAAVAIAFAREGADIALNYLPQEEQDAQHIVEVIRKEGRTAVLLPGDLRVSRSLRRSMRGFTATLDQSFADVVAACADPSREGAWITARFSQLYEELHDAGWAHSIEVWDASGDLAGGLFGISFGAVFIGESMFHHQTDASKAARESAQCSAREKPVGRQASSSCTTAERTRERR